MVPGTCMRSAHGHADVVEANGRLAASTGAQAAFPSLSRLSSNLSRCRDKKNPVNTRRH